MLFEDVIDLAVFNVLGDRGDRGDLGDVNEGLIGNAGSPKDPVEEDVFRLGGGLDINDFITDV